MKINLQAEKVNSIRSNSDSPPFTYETKDEYNEISAVIIRGGAV